MIVAKGLNKSHHRGTQVVHAVRDVDLTVEAGEFLVIEGISGSGKSTLLQLLCGLDRPDTGAVYLGGIGLHELGHDALARLRLTSVGFVFQSFNLLPTLSARDNVEVALVGTRTSARQRSARALELLDQVGMADRSAHTPGRLSGGEQQRVAIARALANEPAVIFADEPTGDLDTGTGVAVIEMLRQLSRDRNTTVVVVTHAPYVTEYATRVATMSDGRLAVG